MTTQRNIEPGDVQIKRMVLFNKDRTARVSLMGQLVMASIYEDLQCPVLYAEIELLDAVNLVQKFPIVGEETIEIEFVTPGLPLAAVYEFAVTSVQEGSADPNAQSSIYTLKCASAEQVTSASKMVQLASTGTYSDLVAQILSRELETDKSAYVQPTRGLMGNVVPKLKPLAAIDYLRRMAISTTSTTSAFVFFENQLGFHFRTIENLIEEGQKKFIKSFKYVPNVSSSKEGSANAQRNVIKYEIISRMDTVEVIQSGLLNNLVQGYDLISKDIRTTAHDLASSISSFATTDKKARSPISRATFQEYGQQPNDTFFIPFDSSKGNIYRDLSFAARRAYTSMLNQNVVRVLVHGDSAMLAGDIINIDFPEVKGTTDRKKMDSFVSGNYLVVRLRHILVNDVKPKHVISADIIKVGYTV